MSVHNEWHHPEPRPRHEWRRRLADEPCRTTLFYGTRCGAHASATISLDGSTLAIVTFDGSTYRELADDLAAGLDRFEAAIRHAARELREGPEPCA